MVYIAMMLLSLIFAIISERCKKTHMKKSYKLFCFLSFMPSFLVSAFRDYCVGTDVRGTYLSIYNSAIRNISSVRDKGFYYINRLAFVLFHNFSGVLIITSAFVCGLAFYCIYRDSDHPAMSVFLFFATNVYFTSMNMIRQSMTTMLFIFAISYIKKRKPMPYFAFIAGSVSIHTTGIIYIPLYLLWKVKLNLKRIIWTLAGLIVSSTAVSAVIELIIRRNAYLSDYFYWYFKSSYFTNHVNVISLTIAILLLLLMLYVYPNAKSNEKYNFYLWLQFFSVCALVLSGRVPLMNRIGMLFSFPQFIYIPETFDFIADKRIRLFAKIGVCGGFATYMIVTIFFMGYQEVFPYQSTL